MLLLSHPTGNTFVRATARALHEREWLYAFHTTVVAPDGAALALMPVAWRRHVLRRRFAEIPRALVRTHPWRECVRLGAEACGVTSLTGAGRWASVDAVYEAFDREVAAAVRVMPRHVAGVYAYEDGAERTFAAARADGRGCVYELPIAYWQTTQRLLREEADRLPAWRPTLKGIDDEPAKLARKDRELDLADVVVVPSRFVLDSLPADIRTSKPCIVARFGSPSTSDRRPPDEGVAARPLRVLFAGALTQRKGLADLFAAMHLLNRTDVELVVMGSLLAPLAFYQEQYGRFRYESPRPHADVLALMRTCDVLALPALVEGRALVQQEALACGLPLVVTLNAGADDLVEEGKTGFIVPVRAPHAIADKLAFLADHRDALEAMRVHAIAKAAAASWTDYQTQVLGAAGLVMRSGARVPAADA